ncbi:polysaccharide pyruvyl transferase family protein [Paenochrobactrum pullorum]|uniref:polysaccharide pyruvyl transferase family protein n=1 Tax=Paenochrobactrum pullorum TaxID=1324351 RepID=UPI0035BC767F
MGTYYLHGGAGAPNFGDELMALQWLDFIQDRTSKNIVLSGYHKNALTDLFSTKYPNVHLTDALSKRQTECADDFWSAFNSGFDFFKNEDPKFSSDEMERILNTSIFHLHGGGYINTLWPKHSFYLGFAAAIKEKLGCLIIGTGLGITPAIEPSTQQDADRLKIALNAFDMLEFRDIHSWNYATKWGGERSILGLDDAFLSPVQTVSLGGNAIHVALHNNKWGNAVIDRRLTKELIESYDRHYFWCCHKNDLGQYDYLIKKYPQFTLLNVKELIFNPLPLGNKDFVVTSRFHPHLIASRVGSRGKFLAIGDYSAVKHGSLLSLGSAFVRTDADLETANPSFEMAALDAERTEKKRLLWTKSITDAV